MSAHAMGGLGEVYLAMAKAATTEEVSGPPSQAHFNRRMRAQRSALEKLNAALASGKIDPRDWADAVDKVLLDGHATAWSLGRQRAGDLRKRNADDDLMGLAAKDGESQWLQAFLDDIEAGRYTDPEGKLRVELLNNRTALYVGKMRGTANEAFVAASPEDAAYDWVLLPELHCQDCPRIAALSPYTRATLFTQPGQGDTQCLGHCKCYLRRGDGVECFKRLDSEDEGNALPEEDAGPVNTPAALPDLDLMTHERYQELGRVVFDEIRNEVEGLKGFGWVAAKGVEIDEAKAALDDVASRFEAAMRRYKKTRSDEARLEANGLVPEFNARLRAHKELNEELGTAWGKVARAKFKAKYGGFESHSIPIEGGTAGQRNALSSQTSELLGMLPPRMREAVKLTKQVKYSRARAHHSIGRIKVSANAPSTLAHEFMHGVEYFNGSELKLSLAFLEDRTKGEGQRLLSELEPSSGYSSREYARPDKFSTPYIGKSYGTRATEILSMGIEAALYGKYAMMHKDRAMLEFILGRLIDPR